MESAKFQSSILRENNYKNENECWITVRRDIEILYYFLTYPEFFLISPIPDFSQAEHASYRVQEEKIGFYCVFRIHNHWVCHYIL